MVFPQGLSSQKELVEDFDLYLECGRDDKTSMRDAARHLCTRERGDIGRCMDGALAVHNDAKGALEALHAKWDTY